MKNFLAVFLGSAASMEKWKALDETERKEREKAGMEGWMKWAIDNKDSIVHEGSPLGKTKRITAEGISDTRNDLAAWVIVQAESHEEAAKLFLNHSHFMMFPGEAIEVMECLPMPEMK